MDDFQVAVHAIGDAANAQNCSARSRSLRDTYKGDRRWRIEHAQIVDPADLPRFGRNTASSPRCSRPTRPRTGGWPRRGWGSSGCRAPMPGARCSPIMSRSPSAPISRSKAPTPFPASPPRSAARTRRASPPGGWMPEQRLTLEQAFAAFTRGARLCRLRRGPARQLEPGHMADFVFIDRDIFDRRHPAADPRDPGAGDLCGGTKVWERHE